MFPALVFTVCNHIACVIAEVDKAEDVSEESGEHDNDDLFVTNQMAEGSGQFGRPEPEGTV